MRRVRTLASIAVSHHRVFAGGATSPSGPASTGCEGAALTKAASIYRPRHPERTVVYRPCEGHMERHVRKYDDRYETKEGLVRKVAPAAVQVHPACGRREGGFARIRCPGGRAEHLLVFSCRTATSC